jgi:hypothetical protein
MATGVFNAEHGINETNARVEALTLQIASQTQIETTTRTTLSFGLMPLSITWEKTSSRKQQTSTTVRPAVRLLTVRLPKWFLQRQYDLQLLRATSGWPFTLSACGIVQDDSPFFNACWKGDIETMKVLLSSKEVSIYDRDPDGDTAFHRAIFARQLEVCQFLRNAGIFAQFDHNDYRNHLSALEYGLNDFTKHSHSLLLVAAPPNNTDRDWFREYRQFPANVLSLLYSLQSDKTILTVSHLSSYFEGQTRRPVYHSCMAYIARVLSNPSAVHEITAAQDEYAWIVYGIANDVAHEYLGRLQSRIDQWLHDVRQALCAVVRAGLNLHQTSVELKSPPMDRWCQDTNMTPLGLLCVEAHDEISKDGHWTVDRCKKDVNTKLQAWLSGLHSAGVDLSQYAESESACYGYSPDLLAIPWKTDARIMVATGPRPEDWRASLWEPCESYARLFWSLVEGKSVVPRLIASILEVCSVPACQDSTSRDLPGSWPSEEARIVEELEDCLLRGTDDELAEIEEDLTLLTESDFFAKWPGIRYVLRIKAVE